MVSPSSPPTTLPPGLQTSPQAHPQSAPPATWLDALSAPVDGYCERLDPGLWAEPVNAVTNLAFVALGALAWVRAGRGAGGRAGRRTGHRPANRAPNRAGRGAEAQAERSAQPIPQIRLLAGLLVAIGLGSGLFHTFANALTGLLDVLPILAFILTYIYLIHRHVWRHSRGRAALMSAGFIPFAAATAPALALIPGLGGSASYAPVPLLIALHAALLARSGPRRGGAPPHNRAENLAQNQRHTPAQTPPQTPTGRLARDLALGAALLCLSITFRALDMPLCGALPMGTHFLWHMLNALMLAHMIAALKRHMLAASRPTR